VHPEIIAGNENPFFLHIAFMEKLFASQIYSLLTLISQRDNRIVACIRGEKYRQQYAMTVKSFFRLLVIEFSRCKPLRFSFSCAYRLIPLAAAMIFRRDRRVLAVYVRDKIGTRDYRPGLSDIDLTIVVDFDAGREAAALSWQSDFRRRYQRLKRVVPVLGEIEIHRRSEFERLLRFGPAPWGSVKYHRPLFERCSSHLRSVAAGEKDRMGGLGRHHILRDIAIRYARYLLPAALEHSRNPGRLQRVLLSHTGFQLAYRFSCLRIDGEQLSAGGSWMEFSEELGRQGLRSAADSVSAAAGSPVPVVAGSETGEQLPAAIAEFAALFSRALASGRGWQLSVLAWNTFGIKGKFSVVVLVPQELSAEIHCREIFAAFEEASRRLERELRAVLADFPLQAPMIFSTEGWRTWMRLLPCEQAEYQTRGVLLSGPEPELGLLTRDVLREYLDSEYASLLSMLHSWRDGAPESSLRLYRELLDQTGIYLEYLKQGKLVLQYPLQEETPSRTIEELFRMFAARLEELGQRLHGTAGSRVVSEGEGNDARFPGEDCSV
jgi:hypothetical protein